MPPVDRRIGRGGGDRTPDGGFGDRCLTAWLHPFKFRLSGTFLEITLKRKQTGVGLAMTRRADQHALVEFTPNIVVELVELDLGDREILLRWIKVMEVKPADVSVITAALALASLVIYACSLEGSLSSNRVFSHARFAVTVRASATSIVKICQGFRNLALAAWLLNRINQTCRSLQSVLVKPISDVALTVASFLSNAPCREVKFASQ